MYEKEDEDPFHNVTVGLSDDEEEVVSDDSSPMDMERMVDEISGIVAEMVV